MAKDSKKLCVIIGVGPGMGISIAKRFGKNDFKIAMIARSKEKLDNYREDLARFGIESSGYSCDVSDLEALDKVMDTIANEQGPAEVAVYNVSILNPGPPSEVGHESLVNDFKTNVAGALVVYKKIISQMAENKDSVFIITGGGLSTDPYFEFASLGVGKAGLRNLALSMAQEGPKLGVRVVTITIKGMIKRGTFFDPEKISLEFWKIYKNETHRRDAEIVFEEPS